MPGPESAAAVSPFRDCSCRVSRYPSMNLYTKHAVGPIAHTNIKRNSKCKETHRCAMSFVS